MIEHRVNTHHAMLFVLLNWFFSMFLVTRVMVTYFNHQIASLLKIRFLDEEVTNNQYPQKVMLDCDYRRLDELEILQFSIYFWDSCFIWLIMMIIRFFRWVVWTCFLLKVTTKKIQLFHGLMSLRNAYLHLLKKVYVILGCFTYCCMVSCMIITKYSNLVFTVWVFLLRVRNISNIFNVN